MMNVYFCLVGVANATRQRPAKSVNQVDGRRSNRNATFQRHDRTWFDEWSIPRLWNSPRTVRDRGSQREPHAKINHKDALRRMSNAS